MYPCIALFLRPAMLLVRSPLRPTACMKSTPDTALWSPGFWCATVPGPAEWSGDSTSGAEGKLRQ